MKAVEEESGRMSAAETRPWGDVKKGYTPFQEGDVLFAKITPCMENGKYAIAKDLHQGRAAGSTEFHVFRPSAQLDAQYLLNFLFSHGVRQAARMNMRGAAGQLRVPAAFFEGLEIPLAPLPDQQRIVAEIEKQFTRLEAGLAGLRRVQANLKRYRAAVLKSACEGTLTDTDAKSWKRAKLGDVLTAIEAGKSFRCEERPPSETEVGIVKVSAVTWGSYEERESKTCLDSTRVEERFLVQQGDFLFSRANTIELVGACVIAKQVSLRVMLSDKILRFRFSRDVLPEWVLYWLRSLVGRHEIERLATGNQMSMRNIGQERIRQIQLLIPPIAEQSLIVSEVERRLSVIDELEAVVTANLQRAFIGELV